MTTTTAAAGPATEQEVATRLRAATVGAFQDASAERQRDPYHVGISALGRCTRANAYALSRTPVSDEPPPEEGRAANLGTWEHEGLLPRIARRLGDAQTEVPVVLRAAGLQLEGHIDLDWSPAGPVDLKTVGEHRLAGVRRTGIAYADHRVQIGGYALARLQAGRRTPFLAWHYLDRATGDEQVLVSRFTNADALAVIDRVQTLVNFAEEPDTAPRDERGPGLSFACDACPWLRRCWGEEAEPGVTGAQSILVRNDADVVEALLAYDTARAQETAAAKVKKDMEARLERTRFSTYGPVPDRPELGIKYTRGKSYDATDGKAAAARLRELGETVPTSRRRGQLQIKLVDIEDGGGQS